MDMVDRETLAGLSRHHEWPSLTLYLPSAPIGASRDEDRIRLKNLIRAGCEGLVSAGMRTSDAEAFVAPARAILHDDTFWRSPSAGIALFVARSGVRSLVLDVALPEQCVAGDRFYLRPLIAAQRMPQPFYVLALDKNGTRLFSADRDRMDEVIVPDTPLTIEEALKYDEAEHSLTTHTTASGAFGTGGGSRHPGSAFAGFGGEKDVNVEQTQRFAKLVERGVSSVLAGDRVPLVLVGNERVLAAYRERNTYAHLAEEQVLGSSDYLTPRQLHAQALSALEPHFDRVRATELTELTEREGSSAVTHDINEIVSAAASGRVKTLFFDEGAGPFGLFDRGRHEVLGICEAEPRYLRESAEKSGGSDANCGWDLVDLAAAETILHGGDVRAFAGEDAPVHGAAAVLRY